MNNNQPIIDKPNFRKELENLINKFSQEQYSNTPDFILADYLLMCLGTFGIIVSKRDKYYGIDRNNNEIEILAE